MTTTPPISNTQIANALSILEDAGVISDDLSSDLLGIFLDRRGSNKDEFYELANS